MTNSIIKVAQSCDKCDHFDDGLQRPFNDPNCKIFNTKIINHKQCTKCIDAIKKFTVLENIIKKAQNCLVCSVIADHDEIVNNTLSILEEFNTVK